MAGLRIDDLASPWVILVDAVASVVEKAWSSVGEVQVEGAVLKELARQKLHRLTLGNNSFECQRLIQLTA